MITKALVPVLDCKKSKNSLQTLFDGPVTVERYFEGVITTRVISSGENTWLTLMDLLCKATADEGTPHPLDNRYIQVPAKLLADDKGNITIITKHGFEIILQRVDVYGGSLTGTIIVNEYYKDGVKKD